LVEAVFFTARVSVYLNRTDILYENSAMRLAAIARDATKRVLPGDSQKSLTPIRPLNRACCI
jgi:hypothetical protein